MNESSSDPTFYFASPLSTSKPLFFLWNQGGSRHKSTKQRSYWNRSTEKKTLVCCFLLTLLYLLFSSSSIRLLSSYAQLYQCCQFLYLLYHFNYILFVYWKSDFFLPHENRWYSKTVRRTYVRHSALDEGSYPLSSALCQMSCSAHGLREKRLSCVGKFWVQPLRKYKK